MIQASNLIRFTPGDHAPGDSDPVERFTLVLSTLLNGQWRTVTSTGSPLAVTLTIAFAEAVRSWCERVRLVGVSPPGHAPLKIELPSAWGEPCAYLGPEDDQPLSWCLDREYENAEDRGPSVEIHWPIDQDWSRPIEQWKPVENLYPFFAWPSPVIGFEPPLEPGETPGPQPSGDIQAIIEAHNAIRRGLGIAEDLVFNPRLSGTVETHVRWLLETYPQYLDGTQPPPDWDPHQGDPNGRLSPGDRAWADGYPRAPGLSVAENLAFHQRTVAELMTSWMNSPPHHAALIDPKWRTMGAAFVPNPSNLLNPGAHLCGALFGEIVEDPLDAVTMELEALENLVRPTGKDKTEIGVQLPMRLMAIKDGQTGETEIEVYNYQKAPGFTGSGDTVTFKHADEVDPQPPNKAVFYLDERTLIERLTDGNAGHAPEPGLYELWWRIYHGSGDMLYRLSCQGSQTDARYRDRRSAGLGGGFGTFQTSDCLAATVRLDPEPYPFVCLSGGTRYNVSAEGDYRALPAETLTGERSWIGPEGEIVTWSDTPGVPISIGGRNIRARQIVATEQGRALVADQYSYMFTCLAACLWRDADGLLWLRAAMAIYSGSTITGARLREFALQVNRQWVTRNTVSAPFIEHTPTLKGRPAASSYAWSQDGTRLCCWAAPVFVDATGSTPAMMYPGAVWATSVITDDGESPITPEIEVFTEAYRDDADPTITVSAGYHSSLYVWYGASFACSWRALICAAYHDNDLRIRSAGIQASGSKTDPFRENLVGKLSFYVRDGNTDSQPVDQQDGTVNAWNYTWSRLHILPSGGEIATVRYGSSSFGFSTSDFMIPHTPFQSVVVVNEANEPIVEQPLDAEYGLDMARLWIPTLPSLPSFRSVAAYTGLDAGSYGGGASSNLPEAVMRNNCQSLLVSNFYWLLKGAFDSLIVQRSSDGDVIAQIQMLTVGTGHSPPPSTRACTGTLAPEIADVHLDAIHLLGNGVCMAPIPRETP